MLPSFAALFKATANSSCDSVPLIQSSKLTLPSASLASVGILESLTGSDVGVGVLIAGISGVVTSGSYLVKSSITSALVGVVG